MPQWAGSCWYYLRFIDPHNEAVPWDPELEKKWMPVDLYVGGAEHAVLHLLYSRFWHKVLFDLGYVSTREPFHKLFNQGMVLNFAYEDQRGALVPVDEVEELEDGTARHKPSGTPVKRLTAKMSKSLKNVITQDEIIGQYGADTLRMFLMFMGPLDVSRPWDSKAIVGNYRFLKKAWQFVNDGILKDGVDSTKAAKALHRLIKRVTDDLEGLHFNTAIAGMMEFLNSVSGETVSKRSLGMFTILLSPFAPHIAEELWESLGHRESIIRQSWPQYDEALLKDDTAAVVIQVNGKKRGLIEVNIDITEDALRQAVVASLESTDYKVTPDDRFITVYQSGKGIPKLVNVLK